jgi:hypothetical protein
VPAVVEPAEPTEQVLVVSVSRGWQVAVTADWRHTGLVGLTLRTPTEAITIPLAGFEVDRLCQLLAAACPLEAVPVAPAGAMEVPAGQCAAPAVQVIEAYHPGHGRVGQPVGRLVEARYACAAHVATVEAEIGEDGMAAYRTTGQVPGPSRRCGEVFDYRTATLGGSPGGAS